MVTFPILAIAKIIIDVLFVTMIFPTRPICGWFSLPSLIQL
jgi:hypothetical protein